MLDERFHEEIDACRPGSRDLDEPEMSRLAEAVAHDPAVRARYEAVQRVDARLTEAFAAVPVPTGLAARLLAGLQQASASAPVNESRETSPAPQAVAIPMATIPMGTVPTVETIPAAFPLARRSPSRRQLLVALAASLLVAVGVWARYRAPSAPAAGEITTEAAVLFENLVDRWQPIADAPADLPLPAAVVARPRGWQALSKQALSKAVAARGVAYSLAQGAKARAVLFVFSAKRPGLPATAPQTPQSATGGLTIGAWQSKGLVYVLVVEGDERAYRRLLNPGRQPLA